MAWERGITGQIHWANKKRNSCGRGKYWELPIQRASTIPSFSCWASSSAWGVVKSTISFEWRTSSSWYIRRHNFRGVGGMPTKTSQGGLSKMDRWLPQKPFAQGGDRCLVKFLELLISKRPESLRATGPLYLRPLNWPREDVWYSSQPVGIQTIDTYMRNMAMLGKLDSTNKKFTKHSIRKTTVRKLQKAGVSNDRIAAITGHRNEQSLRDYADADPDYHRTISYP